MKNRFPAPVCFLSSWPVEMAVKEIERPSSVDGVRSIKPLDLATPLQLQFSLVQVTHFCKFPANRFIGCDSVVMAALDHERPWRDEPGHLRVVEGAAQVPLKNLVLAGVHVAVRVARRGVLVHPLVEVRREIGRASCRERV